MYLQLKVNSLLFENNEMHRKDDTWQVVPNIFHFESRLKTSFNRGLTLKLVLKEMLNVFPI